MFIGYKILFYNVEKLKALEILEKLVKKTPLTEGEIEAFSVKLGKKIRLNCKNRTQKTRKSGFGTAKGIGSFTKEDKKWIEGRHYYE